MRRPDAPGRAGGDPVFGALGHRNGLSTLGGHRMQEALLARKCFPRPSQIGEIIPLVEETGAAVVPAQHEMQRHTIKTSSGHLNRVQSDMRHFRFAFGFGDILDLGATHLKSMSEKPLG